MEVLKANESIITTIASKRKYTISDKVKESEKRNTLKFEGVNVEYWNQFVNSGKASESSCMQYKSSFRRYCEFIGKDVLDGNSKDLESFLDTLEGKTRDNAGRYIKSVLINAIMRSDKKVSKELIEMVVPVEYIEIMKKSL